ncbi:MAG: hypothetical protein HKN85_05635 [Gammaproteobacteria bacterium]|nr:hypothetical protein [Gammaproteobacteria bacterium]
MAFLKKLGSFIRKRDWRITVGASITLFWIIGSIWYVIDISVDDAEQTHSMATMGSFLEGAFAPLAFMWLVLGMFIQQRELANNTEAIRHTVQQSEIQTQVLLATEMNARRDTFFEISKEVKLQLGGISGMLLMSSLGPPGSGRYDRQKMQELFAHLANGDTSLFARMFISTDYDEEGGLPELFYGTEIRQRHTANYMRSFERLCRLARNCDIDDIIEDALKEGAFGLLYQRMVTCAPQENSTD